LRVWYEHVPTSQFPSKKTPKLENSAQNPARNTDGREDTFTVHRADCTRIVLSSYRLSSVVCRLSSVVCRLSFASS